MNATEAGRALSNSQLDVETFDVLRAMADQVRVRRRRTISQFAEQEITLPSGRFEGQKYRIKRNPSICGPWFWGIEHAREFGWRRFAATGGGQMGKTLNCFTIPIMWGEFEMGWTMVVGAPTGEIVEDKWLEDLLPCINASGYREQLPRIGSGSRGGSISDRIMFLNGQTLRFMTGGGDDKSRANFTARAAAITEVDGMDIPGSASRESDPASQIEARTNHYGDQAIVFLECTASTPKGRIWVEFKGGTESRVAIRCPHCREFVTPEREHLVGWRDAGNVVDAGEMTRIGCPLCQKLWDESERQAANHDWILLHRGQTADAEKRIQGDVPRTDTFSFRWNCLNNLLSPMSIVGQKEFKKRTASDEETAEKELVQFFWAQPHLGSEEQLSSLEASVICRRTMALSRGIVPDGTTQVTVGVDVGSWFCNWVAIAWRPGATGHIVDYGVFDVPGRDLGVERGIIAALHNFLDSVVARGFAVKVTADSDAIKPRACLADSRFKPRAVERFCDESQSLFCPSMGFGVGQDGGPYRQPREKSESHPLIGEGYYLSTIAGSTQPRVNIDADHWKSWVHARFETAIGQSGAMTLFDAPPRDHMDFARHLVAEKQIQEFVAGKGMVVRWKTITRVNHYFDATALACVAGHLAGQRLLAQIEPRKAAPSGPRIHVSDWVKNGV